MTDGSPIAELHEARARFVDELERGVDPQEALENFIPAVMAVLPIARTVDRRSSGASASSTSSRGSSRS